MPTHRALESEHPDAPFRDPFAKTIRQDLLHAGAPFRFAPKEGPAFLERARWKPLEP